MNGLVAQCCGLRLGRTVPGSTAHSVCVKPLLIRRARRMQATYVLGKNDSLQLPKGAYNFLEKILLLTTWKYLIRCLKQWKRTEEGRPPAITLLTRNWRRKGQWPRCLIEAHVGWSAMFSGAKHFKLGKSWLEMRQNEVKWCSWSTPQFCYSTCPWQSEENNSFPNSPLLIEWTSPTMESCSGCVFEVGFQPTQHLRQCSGYGSYSIRVLLFQVLPTLSFKVSVIPGIRCTKLEENWLSPVQAFVPPFM